MSLTLKITSHNRRGLGPKASMTFGQDGGTIGRSLQNDWALPDTKKYLSSKHACIDFRSGCYYIVDTSRNGVFINGSHEPVGGGAPQRLFEGDTIRMGDYEMSVAIASVDETRETLAASSHVDPVDLKLRVETPEPTGYDLLAAHAMTGVELEITLEDEDDAPQPAVATRTQPGKKPDAARPAATPAASPIRTDAASSNPLDAFFRGVGIAAPSIDGAAANRILMQIGQVARELVGGLVDNMQLRAVQCAQLGLTSASVADGDTALDFSRNVEDNLRRLFLNTDAGANPAESVRDAYAHLRAHQRALLAGSRQAVNDYLTRLDPETIEHGVSHGKRGTLLSAANRFRYWDVYKDVYSVLGNRSGDEWPEPFRSALAEAYARLTGTVVDDSDEPEQRAAG